jgi:hypothetical protein
MPRRSTLPEKKELTPEERRQLRRQKQREDNIKRAAPSFEYSVLASSAA